MTESVTKAEQEIAEDTVAFCMKHMQEHYTIQRLAERAGLSPTKLKSYSGVYMMHRCLHIFAQKRCVGLHAG